MSFSIGHAHTYIVLDVLSTIADLTIKVNNLVQFYNTFYNLNGKGENAYFHNSTDSMIYSPANRKDKAITVCLCRFGLGNMLHPPAYFVPINILKLSNE